ncbi:MAG: hydroxyacid dehydrogenase [Fusobacteriaceae bacterium]|jgi:D-3-phosphoglycerate dehydrogenase|nr:hydroxyacid dehydrogenase [Fusobacteriaceae bacterium]
MAYKVLVPQAVAAEGTEFLKKRGYEIKEGRGASEADLIADVADCDAILLRTAPCTAAVIEAGKKLRIVARHGAGYNNVDLAAAAKKGVWVTNAPDATTNTVAEFTIGAVLATAKRTFLLNQAMKKGDFFFKNDHKGLDLEGKTLGIIGLGRIGRKVAHKAYFGLDMKIVAYDPFAARENTPEYVKLASYEEVFRSADFVSLHMPLTAENKNSIGINEFSLMKPTAYFINCARGELVREEDLAQALREGVIAGAFLDVFQQEPPAQDNPLLALENVVATPHMASNTEECMMLMATQAAAEIDRVLSGGKPEWPVNKPDFLAFSSEL